MAISDKAKQRLDEIKNPSSTTEKTNTTSFSNSTKSRLDNMKAESNLYATEYGKIKDEYYATNEQNELYQKISSYGKDVFEKQNLRNLNTDITGKYDWIDKATQEEQDYYYYLVGHGHKSDEKENVENYLKSKYSRGARLASSINTLIDKSYEFENEHNLPASVWGEKAYKGIAKELISVPLSVGGLFDLTDDAIQYAATGQIDNSSVTGISEAKRILQEEVTNDVVEGTKDSKFWNWENTGISNVTGIDNFASFLVDTGFSTVQSLAIAQIPYVGLAILGTEAGASAVTESLQEGCTPEQALGYGVLAGAFETLFEKVSLENVIKAGEGGESLIKTIIKSGFTEGSEEVATEISNMIAGAVIKKDKSEWAVNKAEYLATHSGATEKEAESYALRKAIGQVNAAFLGGAISGGAMSGASTAINKTMTKADISIAMKTNPQSVVDAINEIGAKSGKNYSIDVNSKVDEIYKAYTDAIKDVRSDAIRQQFAANGVAEDKIDSYTDTARKAIYDYQSNFGDLANRLDPKVRDIIKEGKSDAEWKLEADVVNDAIIHPTKAVETAGTETKADTTENTTDTEKPATEPVKPLTEGQKQLLTDIGRYDEVLRNELAVEDAKAEDLVKSFADANGYNYDELFAEYSEFKKANPTKTANYYLNSIQLAETYGKSGASLKDVIKNIGYSDKSINKSYDKGVNSYKASRTEEYKTAEMRKNGVAPFTGRIRMATEEEISEANIIGGQSITATENLTDEQKAQMGFWQNYYKDTVVNLRFFKGGGKVGDSNGAFYYGNNTVFIDVDSDMVRKGLHEFTHAARFNTPQVYDELQSYVIAEVFDGNEISFVDAVERKYVSYNNALKTDWLRTHDDLNGYKEYSRENCAEEVIAESVTKVFDDVDTVQEKMAKMSTEHKNLFQRILDFLKDFASKLKQAIAKYGSANVYADKLAENKKTVDHVIDLMLKARQGMVATNSNKLFEVTADNKSRGLKASDGRVDFSLKENANISKRSIDYYNLNKGKGASHISEAMFYEANKIIERMTSYMLPYLDITNNNGKRYLPEEILGKTTFTNGSYGRTIENTTICFRTLAYIDFTNEIKKKIGRPLTVEESFLASQMLYDIAIEPQCLYCYVSLDRKAYDGFLLEYIKQRDEVIDKFANLKNKNQANIDKLYDEFLNGRKNTKQMRSRFNLWINSAINGKGLISLSDLTTEEVRSSLKNGELADQINDAERYAQGASWAKKLEQYRSYNSDILRMSDTMVKKLNAHYGLRFYSFSEYTPAFIVENMQQIRDASLKGLYGLAYTKKIDFARIFANTGMNINISVFGKMVDGKVVADTRQGADWNEVQEIRNQYKNVGAVFVATSDELTEWALAQDWIDVVIPFHIVRTGANVAEFYKWTNNTKFQADVDKDGKNKTISPAEHHNDLTTFKKLIQERELTPRFAQFIDNPNYMKLVNETRLADTKSTKLVPNFTDETYEAAKKSFDTFVNDGGYYGNWYNANIDYNKAVTTVAEDIISGKRANEVTYGRQDINIDEQKKNLDIYKKSPSKKAHGQTMLSIKDSEYMELAKNPEENDAKLRKMVEEVAREKGYNSVKLFHGSDKFGFTKVKTSGIEKNMDWSPFFATNKEEIAATYTIYNKVREISEDADEDYLEERIEETKTNITDLIDDFRYLIDKTFSEWVFGQSDNSYLESGVERANAEPGHGDGVYDFLDEIVANAFYDYEEQFNEYEDVGDWAENSEEGKKIYKVINDIETEKSNLSDLESGNVDGGVYELYANLDKMYELDAKGNTWNSLRPEGLPKINKYGREDMPYNTREVAQWAKENGYKGVIFKNIFDNGKYGRTSMGDVYVFFNPESQVKSADPVTYDDSGNIIPLSERFKSDNEDIRYSFAGENANINKKNLEVAKNMETQGIDKEKIRFATGWFKSYDGKWRNEIDDSGASLNENLIVHDLRYIMDEPERMYDDINRKLSDAWSKPFTLGTEEYEEQLSNLKTLRKEMEKARDLLDRARRNRFYLSDILIHPRLFKAYPKLKKMRVQLDYQHNGVQGTNYGDSIAVAVDERTNDEILKTIMHEIQHSIQKIEGFAEGSNPGYWVGEMYQYDPEVKKYQSVVDDLKNKLKAIEYNGDADSSPVTVSELYVYFKKQLRSDKMLKQTANIKYDEQKVTEYEKIASEQGYLDLLKQYLTASQDLEAAIAESRSKNNISAFDLYSRTAGEVEARDVENRLKLTPKERKNTAPDINRDNVVFVNYSLKDSDGNTLSPSQQEYFKDSKVRDEDGNLLVVYHGSKNNFTVFNPKGNSQFGEYKFRDYNVNYFTTDKASAKSFSTDNATGKTNQLLEGYVNITNPFRIDANKSSSFGIQNEELVKLANKLIRKIKREFGYVEFNKDMQVVIDSMNKLLMPLNLELRVNGKDYELYKLGNNSMFGSDDYIAYFDKYELFDMLDDESVKDYLDIQDDKFFDTDSIAKMVIGANDLLGENYDGIIIDNVFDAASVIGANFGTDCITFNSNQFKDTENKTPTSNDDIRYSMKEIKDAQTIKSGSLYSGGGLLEAGLEYELLKREFAVEWEDKIAMVYRDNYGDHILSGKVNGNVLTFDSSKYRDVYHVHASPICHNFSPAKIGAKELETDKASARNAVKHFAQLMPRIATVENGEFYKGSESEQIIVKGLEELGYKVRSEVYDSADYGSATSRRRTIIVAVRDGELPPMPTKVARTNTWDAVTSDLWNGLADYSIPDWLMERVNNTKGLDINNITTPTLVITTTKGKQVSFVTAGKQCPTLTTKCGEGFLLLPGGSVKKTTPRFMARIMGLPDTYKFPTFKNGKTILDTSYTIIGNGIPVNLTKAVIGGALENAYQEDYGTTLYSINDSEYLELAKDPKKNEAKLQEMVDATAKDNGFDLNKLYHGTDSNFTSFDVTKSKWGGMGYGIYFSDNSDISSEFKKNNGRLISAYTIPNNLADQSEQYHKITSEQVDQLLKELGIEFKNTIGRYSDSTSSWVSKHDDYEILFSLQSWLHYKYELSSDKIDTVLNTISKITGYDGMVREKGNGNEYVIWNNKQVKSADPVTYDDSGNVIPLSKRFDTSNDDIRYSLNDNLGHHAGDLGKAEPYSSMRTDSSSTGHFGTGTYFVGDEKEINYMNYKARPHEKVDFSKYNMYRPTSENKGFKLHDFLRDVDSYFNYTGVKSYSEYEEIIKKFDKALDDYEEISFDDNFNLQIATHDEKLFEALDIAKELLGTRSFENAFNNAIPYINGSKDSYNFEDDGTVTIYNWDENKFRTVSKDELLEVISDSKFKFSEIRDSMTNYYFGARISRYEDYANSISSVVRDLFGISKDKADSILSKIQETYKDINRINANTTDTPGTMFMKELGYEGIDVRGFSGLDNTKYGSVIYDLKGEDFARKQEIGTARFSMVDDITDKELLAEALDSHIIKPEDRSTLSKYKMTYNESLQRANTINSLKSQLKDETDAIKKATIQKQINEQQKKLNDRNKELKSILTMPRMIAIVKDMREEVNQYRWALQNADDKLLAEQIKNGKLSQQLYRKLEVTEKRFQQYKAGVAESKGINYYRPRIEKVTKELIEMLTDRNKKYPLADAFKQPILAVVNTLNFAKSGSMSKKTMDIIATQDALQKLYKEMDTPEKFISKYGTLFPEDMKMWIESIQQYLFDASAVMSEPLNVNDMTAEQLKSLYNFLKVLNKTAKWASKSYTNKATDMTDVSKETMGTLVPLAKNTDTKFKAVKDIRNFMVWDNATPATVFARLGSGGDKIYKLLRQGQAKLAFNQAKIEAKVAEIKGKYGITDKQIHEWYDDENEIVVGGTTMKVPTAAIAELYASLQDEDAYRHAIEGGGITFAEFENGKMSISDKQAHLLTELEIADIFAKLDGNLTELIDEMHQFLSEFGAQLGNEVSVSRYGIEAFVIPKYYPIKTIESLRNDARIQEENTANLYRMLNQSFTKQRNLRANNAIVIGNFFETFATHMGKMATYNAYAMPVLDTLRWLNYRTKSVDSDGRPVEESVQDAMKNAYGDEMIKYLNRLLVSINGSYGDNDPTNPRVSRFLAGVRMYNRVAVSWNLRVAAQQPTSIVRAFDLLNPKYLAKPTKNTYKEMISHSGIAMWKDLGYFNNDVSKQLSKALFGEHGEWASAVDKFSDMGMELAEKMDAITWATLWESVKNEVSQTLPELKDDAYWNVVTEKFEDIIYQTQVVDSVLTKSQWMRSSGAFQKVTSAFKGEPTTSYNMLLKAVDKFNRDVRVKGMQTAYALNKTNMLKAFALLGLSALLQAIVTAPIDAWRDDDDYETILEKLLEAFKNSLIGDGWVDILTKPIDGIPAISDLAELFKGYSVTRPDLDWVSDAIGVFKTGWSMVTNNNFSSAKNWFKIIRAASQYSGFAFANIMRDAVGIWNITFGMIDSSIKIQFTPESRSSGYDAYYQAYRNGNANRVGELIAEMESNGISQTAMWNGLVSQCREDYRNNNISYADAKEYLKSTALLIGITRTDKQIDQLIAGW